MNRFVLFIGMLFTLLFISNVRASQHVMLGGPVDPFMASRFLYDIEKSKGKTHFVGINSGGGSVLHGFVIINYMKKKQALGHKFICTVKGYSMSMAFTILQACDSRRATKNSSFMEHRAKPRDWLSSQYDMIRFNLTNARLLIPVVKFEKGYIDPERTFGSGIALKIGIIDEII